jgi:hypothetical protein
MGRTRAPRESTALWQAATTRHAWRFWRNLARQGRQAGVLAAREISEAYWAPLGVWVVREVARKAMRTPPARFASLAEALAEMEKRIRTPAGQWRKQAQILAGPVQRSLIDF